jgi:hypothetical protein
MATNPFKKATKKQAYARIAMIGQAKSGKTWKSLTLASELGKKIAVMDTERGSASKYSNFFEFDVMEMESFSPDHYIAGMMSAQDAGYEVLIIDSWSHAWMGKDGILEKVDRKGGFAGGGWRDMTPLQNRLVDKLLQCKMHVIATMRTKTEYVVEKNDKGKSVPRKVGMAPVQRDGMEYEFDIVATINANHDMEIGETRCPALDGRIFSKETTTQAGIIIRDWLTDGVEVKDEPAPKDTTHGASPTSRITNGSTTNGIDGPKVVAATATSPAPTAPLVEIDPADKAAQDNVRTYVTEKKIEAKVVQGIVKEQFAPRTKIAQLNKDECLKLFDLLVAHVGEVAA